MVISAIENGKNLWVTLDGSQQGGPYKLTLSNPQQHAKYDFQLSYINRLQVKDTDIT